MLNMQWRPPLPRKWLGRVTPVVYFENVLGGVDAMLHGNNLRGWGAQPVVDPVLLVPRGFDPATQRFRYTVNPRFADTRATNTLVRNPFRITLDFSLNLSTDFGLQQLRRAVEPVRAPDGGWTRRSADSLAAFYLSHTSSVHKLLLENSDSLFLSKPQIAALQRADSVYSAQVRAIYMALGEYLAERNVRDPGKADLDHVRDVQKAYWKVFWEQPEIADSIVTPSQRELIPEFSKMLAVPAANRVHAEWTFGHPVTFADRRKTGPN